MITLTEISIGFRKSIIWVIVLFFVYLVVKSLIDVGIGYWKAKHPIPTALPDVRFNKIPQPKFSSIATSSSGMKFILENIEGRPPETTTAGKVYSMPKKTLSLLSSDRAKKIAERLGFTDEPQTITSTYYRFTDKEDNLRTLDLDIVNMNFKLKYEYSKDPQLFGQGKLLNKDQAVNEVSSFIRSNGLFDESIVGGKITTALLVFDPTTTTFFLTTKISAANAIRINFTRENINGFQVLPPAFDQSFNYALFSGADSLKSKIVELFYTFWPIDFANFATYPLRSSQTAWQDLVDGYAYVVRLGNNTAEKIIIRKIYLAYYDSEESQNYLQPIFVFEGDNDFIAYLPAITSEWLE